jgi:hypothetical protein
MELAYGLFQNISGTCGVCGVFNIYYWAVEK